MHCFTQALLKMHVADYNRLKTAHSQSQQAKNKQLLELFAQVDAMDGNSDQFYTPEEVMQVARGRAGGTTARPGTLRRVRRRRRRRPA